MKTRALIASDPPEPPLAICDNLEILPDPHIFFLVDFELVAHVSFAPSSCYESYGPILILKSK